MDLGGENAACFAARSDMAQKNRPSVQKREREQKKRQRESAKVAKAAEKRERRAQQKQAAQSTLPSSGVGPSADGENGKESERRVRVTQADDRGTVGG